VNLEERYPKIFSRLEDKDIELRHLINVDENYEDYDSEEFEYDFEEYNYLIYITELSKNCLDEDGLQTYIAKLEANEAFENFLASEEDLFAIKTNLSEDEIADLFLSNLEECIS
jgi:hypothetical protein